MAKYYYTIMRDHRSRKWRLVHVNTDLELARAHASDVAQAHGLGVVSTNYINASIGKELLAYGDAMKLEEN